MKHHISIALLTGVTILGFAATAASAAVICNDEGDCWRVREERRYEPWLRLRVMPDDWRWKEGENYRWREPGRGHGYWRQGVWIEIKQLRDTPGKPLSRAAFF